MQTNLLAYLEQSASRFGDRPAFIDEQGAVSYACLQQKARALGAAIAQKTGAFNRPVAVLTDRTIAPVIGFMGVLYSGNCYVPIDCKMPKARMDSLMETLNPAAVVYAEEYAPIAQGYPNPICLQQALEGRADEGLLAEIRRRTIDLNPAYMIFTSGSTGTPKGIAVSHRSVIDFTDWYKETMGIGPEDILGNQAPFYFDLSVKDLYTGLATGAAVHLLPQKFFVFPALLVRYAAEQKITTFSWATSAFHLVANAGVLKKGALPQLKRVILGGEALQARQLNIWRAALPEVQYVNLYGPTEVTVDCTYYFIDRDFADGDPIPIGKPCANKEIILLREDLTPAPPGTPGEICVRGSGLALGYYGDKEKTAAAFIQNPLNPYYNDLLYRTGDIGVLDESGNLQFLARKDNQIKHGGYRIELGEVETALSGIAALRAAVCLFDKERDKIVCFFEGEADGDAIARALREKLPKYMLPNIYIQKEKMPYNANGKLDRAALREEYHAKNQP